MKLASLVSILPTETCYITYSASLYKTKTKYRILKLKYILYIQCISVRYLKSNSSNKIATHCNICAKYFIMKSKHSIDMLLRLYTYKSYYKYCI